MDTHPGCLGVEMQESPEARNHVAAYSGDFQEAVSGTPAPAGDSPVSAAAMAIAPAATQPSGALSGRVVFTSGGHGWVFNGSGWGLQRPVLLEMNEDYGNIDQMNFFAFYCFNAGATVVPMRPVGNQTNEVVLDNDDVGVTFSGSWSDSSSTLYYGSPGDVPYRFASIAAAETATANYTPNIPQAGLYPVYAWTRHGSDRTSQLYRILHTGGESTVRVPHERVGNGWVYLGTYYFNAGSNPSLGRVIISNLQPSPSYGTVVIADAIRFGNGMSADGSTYPKEEECSRYWIKNSLGQGQSTSIYNTGGNDASDNVGAPIRMAREMNREAAGNLYDRVYIGFHSNAGGGRSSDGLWNDESLFPGTATPNQFRLAELIGEEVENDLVGIGSPPLEVPWFSKSPNTFRRTDFAFGEINNNTINDEFDATIIEVAFHDSSSDTLLLRDPKARNWIGRASYHAVLKYMNEFDAAPLTFLPDPPSNVRAIQNGSNITVSWTAPVASGGSGSPSDYIVYQSTDGFGFGNPVSVGSSGTTALTLTNVPLDTTLYFRIAAVNSGGESFPSETVGCRISSNPTDPSILVVNGFDRFDRTLNPRQTPAASNYLPPGHDNNGGTMDRVLPRRINAFDYISSYASALANAGQGFDSCQNEAVVNVQVALPDYDIVIWACGNESVADETFSAIEQVRVAPFMNAGGHLFVSGSDIAWDLDRAVGPTTADRAFLNDSVHVALDSDADDDSESYSVIASPTGIFAGNAGADIDDGNDGIYWVPTPDIVTPSGAGASPALNYAGGSGGVAAVQYDGSSGGGNVVVLGFPFETLTSAAARNAIMDDVLDFFTVPTNAPPVFTVQPQDQVVAAGGTAAFTAIASGTQPIDYQWQRGGVDVPGATGSTLTIPNLDSGDVGGYRLLASNAFGSAASDVAGLFIALPSAEYVAAFEDDFDANTASNWVTNRSSTDTRVTFNYDYSADGVAPAPDTTNGTTRGVKFEANLAGGLAAAINVSPIGQSFAGDYRMRFNMWINANGPFPGGGTGSTEHFTAGVGTSGDRVQWTGSGTADGAWFVVDGEGGTSDTSTTSLPDFGALTGSTLWAASSGVYAAGTASNSRGNGNPYYLSTFPGGQTAPPAQISAYPQQTGSLNVGTVGFGWRSVLIEKTGSTIECFLDGLKLATLSGVDSAGNVFLGYWDSYSSVSDNTALSFGLADNLVVEVPVTNYAPVITIQPEPQVVEPGGSAVFIVEAGASPAPGYQWLLDGTNIGGATSNSLPLSNLQPANAGLYSVVVSNAFGVVTSATAELTVVQPAQVTPVGVTGGVFQMELATQPGVSYTVEGSTNLLDWEVLDTFIATNSPVLWSDTSSTNFVLRFYRSDASAP
jgi:hypothetical protein